jgi:hypothetical protein
MPAEAASAVFTYDMPDCFQLAGAEVNWGFVGVPKQVAAILPVVGGNADNMILIMAGEFDDTSTQSDAEIEENMRRGDELAGLPPRPFQRRTVAGARAWGTSGQAINGKHSESWVILKDRLRISVSCSWAEEALRARIRAGCAHVLDTLTIA